MTQRFRDRTVLVTGASRGLGRAIAVAFGREGAWVGIAYRDRKREAEQTLVEVADAGGTGRVVSLDVTQDDSVQAGIDQVLEARGGVDVLVNNAGVIHDELFALSSLEAWEQTLSTNLLGAVRCTRCVVRGMLRQQAGAIVNIGSVAALRANPGQSSYGASKSALLSLTRTLAAELAPGGIRVNAVVPGLLDAGMAHRLSPAQRKRAIQNTFLGRAGTAAEAAAAVLFLASDEARYVVGQTLVVDGGLSL
jgi:3-oxoacyl-[acyl-carrier protein] reductase